MCMCRDSAWIDDWIDATGLYNFAIDSEEGVDSGDVRKDKARSKNTGPERHNASADGKSSLILILCACQRAIDRAKRV